MEKAQSAFTDILAEATRRTRGILGAVFLDDEGEPIDEFGLGKSDLDLQITGAHIGLILKKTETRLAHRKLGKIISLAITCQNKQLLAHRVADEYVVVFVVQPSLNIERALGQLTTTAAALAAAM